MGDVSPASRDGSDGSTGAGDGSDGSTGEGDTGVGDGAGLNTLAAVAALFGSKPINTSIPLMSMAK